MCWQLNLELEKAHFYHHPSSNSNLNTDTTSQTVHPSTRGRRLLQVVCTGVYVLLLVLFASNHWETIQSMVTNQPEY